MTSSGVALVVISRDISERMQIESELRTLNRDLEKQNRLNKELTAALCHRLTALVTEFKDIISEALTGTLDKINPELKENLESAARNIDEVTETIRDVLDVSQIDDGEVKVELSELGLRSVVSQILRALEPLASERGVDLENLAPGSEPTAGADWNKIIRVLTSLAENAARTGVKGHTKVRAKEVGAAK